MRGHGCATVGPTLPHAVFRSVYLEINAKLQAQAMALGGPVTYLDPEEAKQADHESGDVRAALGAVEAPGPRPVTPSR